MKKAVVLLSGGLDSVVLLHSCRQDYDEVMALSFDYASKHNAKELACARWQTQHLGVLHEVVDITSLSRLWKSDLLLSGGDIPEGAYASDNLKQTIVPFRNGVMLALATAVAESWGAQEILLAAHAGDHVLYPDCRPEFVAAMGQAIEFGTQEGIVLKASLVHHHKSDIVALGEQEGVDFSQTWSCYKGGERHCGRCSTCQERREAFVLAGVEDVTSYEEVPEGPLS